MSALVSSLRSFFSSKCPGQDEENPLELTATPGLMTLLDFSMHKAVEGELTATLCAGHALLITWLDLKHQAQTVLSSDGDNSFARTCLECASDAIEKISTDRLASSANLSDAYETFSSSTILSGISDIPTAIADSKNDSGRQHLPLLQQRRDCWETARLVCVDHVWADDVYLVCQRHVRHLSKHALASQEILQMLVLQDLPMRLHQFRAAMEANSVVSKRLYLVKCEYRAPFRAFLEAHYSVQRAPSLKLVDDYLKVSKSNLPQRRKQAEARLQSLLETPELLNALALEKECEMMEVNMAQALYPFTELARFLDNKRCKCKAMPGTLEPADVPQVQETLRRLKSILCRKAGPDTSPGIRPLLLDLQGLARDEEFPKTTGNNNSKDAMLGRLQVLAEQLALLQTLSKTRGSFVSDKQRGDNAIDVPSTIQKDCNDFDTELFTAQCKDWFVMVHRQHELSGTFTELETKIRRAELEMGIVSASSSNLYVIRQRLEQIDKDRQKRFRVLKEIVEQVCRREMNWHVNLVAPDKDETLELATTSVLGVYGVALKMAGEELPIG